MVKSMENGQLKISPCSMVIKTIIHLSLFKNYFYLPAYFNTVFIWNAEKEHPETHCFASQTSRYADVTSEMWKPEYE